MAHYIYLQIWPWVGFNRSDYSPNRFVFDYSATTESNNRFNISTLAEMLSTNLVLTSTLPRLRPSTLSKPNCQLLPQDGHIPNILICQWHYVLSILFKFGMADGNPSQLLWIGMWSFTLNPEQHANRHGSDRLLEALYTWPSAAGLVTQFMSELTIGHLQCTQRIPRYVSGTKNKVL